MAHLIDWDSPTPAGRGLLAVLRHMDRDWFAGRFAAYRGYSRPRMERSYADALVRRANRAVLRDTLRRLELTAAARAPH